MAPVCSLLEVSPIKEDCRLIVRVLSKWQSHPYGKPEQAWSLDAVVCDEEGNRIQVTIKIDWMCRFDPILVEGDCFSIQNFGVGDNAGRLPLLNHQYRINFRKNTICQRVESFNDNVHGFKFVSIPDILAMRVTEKDAVDVIGSILTVGELVMYNSIQQNKVDKKRRQVVIEDVDGNKITCTFWDAYADVFETLAQNPDTFGHVVVIIQLAKVKTWLGVPSVQNALFGTKIYMNADMPEMNFFRKRYSEKDGYDASKFKITMSAGASTSSAPSSFFDGGVKMNIDEIKESPAETICIVFAKIHNIMQDSEWSYMACKKCHSKATEIGAAKKGDAPTPSSSKRQSWSCNGSCGVIYSAIPRYKVVVRVIDETGSASLLLFDHMVNKLINKTAYQLRAKTDDFDENGFPNELKALVGKKMLFKFLYSEFNISNNNHVYRVKTCSDDPEIVKLWGNTENVDQDVSVGFVTPTSTIPAPKGLAYALNNEEIIQPNFESAGSSGGGSGSGSCKRVFVDLDNEPEGEKSDNRGKKPMVEVKIEKP